jgi:hypothetical protein
MSSRKWKMRRHEMLMSLKISLEINGTSGICLIHASMVALIEFSKILFKNIIKLKQV